MSFIEQWKRMIHSHAAATVLVVVGLFIVGLLIFHAGVAYGERQAFSRLGHPQDPGLGILPHSYIPLGHGAVGSITAVHLPTLMLLTRDGENEMVSINKNTVIRSATDTPLGPADLHEQQNVIVIGDPIELDTASTTADTDDVIDAHIIRILPATQY